MPFYEYYCSDNQRTVVARHGMSETLTTWGEVTQRSDVDPGSTPESAPVERVLSVPTPSPSSRSSAPAGCGSGCACVPGA